MVIVLTPGAKEEEVAVLREVLHNLDLRYPPGDPALEKITVV